MRSCRINFSREEDFILFLFFLLTITGDLWHKRSCLLEITNMNMKNSSHFFFLFLLSFIAVGVCAGGCCVGWGLRVIKVDHLVSAFEYISYKNLMCWFWTRSFHYTHFSCLLWPKIIAQENIGSFWEVTREACEGTSSQSSWC